MIETLKPAGFTTAHGLAAGLGLLCGAACRTSTLRRLRAELVTARRTAERDALTGLLNRTGLERHHQHLATSGARPAMVLIDLDGFKAVNDTWGHQTGDSLLNVVAERLTTRCARTGAVPGRLAGDEFLVLVPNPETVLHLAPAVLAALSEPATLRAGDHRTTTVLPMASAGIALAEPHTERDSAWRSQLHRADIALYHAKVQRGHAVTHTHGMSHPPRHGAHATQPALGGPDHTPHVPSRRLARDAANRLPG